MGRVLLLILCTTAFILHIIPHITGYSLIAFSTQPHFHCNAPQNLCPSILTSLPVKAVNDFVSHLTDETTDTSSGYLSDVLSVVTRDNKEKQVKRRVIVVVGGLEDGGRVDLLENLKKIVGRGWGVGGVGVREFDAGEVKGTVKELENWEQDGQTGVVVVQIESAEERKRVLNVIDYLSKKKGRLGVVWVGRQSVGDAPTTGSKEKNRKGEGTKQNTQKAPDKKTSDSTAAGNKTDKTKKKAATEKEKKDKDRKDTDKKDVSSEMNPPELSAGGFTGLFIVGMLLIIFIPGFLCLWNIQTPATFDTLDEPSVVKKMQ